MKIAVIGAGISGLSCAYYLSKQHEVWLLEKETRIGGHTHTISVKGTPVDTGFIVHNDRTYPNFQRLMRELGVESQPSDMSFAVTSPNFEYASHGLNSYFAQRSLLFSPAHYALLREIMRFNREAPKLLDVPNAEELTLLEFLRQGQYSQPFIERYLYPMASAIWSMPNEGMHGFPALTLVRFFHNHGMLGINTHPKWKTIRGGSNTYIAPMTMPYRERILSGVEVAAVERREDGVTVKIHGRADLEVDQVVFACHGDQVLPMLAKPTERERTVFADLRTSSNDTCLHTDTRLLPKRPLARASWNYLLGKTSGATLTYHMNRLQSLRTEEQYCVTLNATASIDPAKIIRRMNYEHPVYSKAAIRAQTRWSEVSGLNRTHYCGAYWFYGFHEDGVNSAIRVAKSLGIEV